jgi:hypothetical protein
LIGTSVVLFQDALMRPDLPEPIEELRNVAGCQDRTWRTEPERVQIRASGERLFNRDRRTRLLPLLAVAELAPRDGGRGMGVYDDDPDVDDRLGAPLFDHRQRRLSEPP